MSLLAVLFIWPGRLMAEIAYLFPAKGKVWESARQRNNVYIHIMYSLGLYMILGFSISQLLAQHASHKGDLATQMATPNFSSQHSASETPATQSPANQIEAVTAITSVSAPSSIQPTPPPASAMNASTTPAEAPGPVQLPTPQDFSTTKVFPDHTFSQFAKGMGRQVSEDFIRCADDAKSESAALDCERSEYERALGARADLIQRSDEPEAKTHEFDVGHRIANCGQSETLVDATCRLVEVSSTNYAQGIRP